MKKHELNIPLSLKYVAVLYQCGEAAEIHPKLSDTNIYHPS